MQSKLNFNRIWSGLAPAIMIGATVLSSSAQTTPLQNAVDNTALSFSSGSNSGIPGSEWYRQSAINFDGADAARCGPVPQGRWSWFDADVVGPGTISYYGKVSSDSSTGDDGAGLQFFIAKPTNGNDFRWLLRHDQRGISQWELKSSSVPAGRHKLRWQYWKGEDSDVAGEDTGWVDQIVWSPVAAVPLTEALDAPGLSWVSSGPNGAGGNQWFGTALQASDGVDSARSPILDNAQSSWIQTEVTGPGSLSFEWQVSSDASSGDDGSDLQFYLGAPGLGGAIAWTFKNEIRGEVTWSKKTYSIASGRQILRWQYWKGEDSDDFGSDAGWIDKVSYVPDSQTTAPGLQTSALSFALTVVEGTSGSLAVPYTNTGTQPLIISDLKSSQLWGNATTATSTTGGLSGGVIRFDASAAGLAPGDYSAVLTVSSNAVATPSQTIEINMQVIANTFGDQDKDSDGMSDAFEITHSLNRYRNDADEDADGDGYSNFLEMQYATSPSSSTSKPAIDVIIDTSIEIVIPTKIGVRYQIQTTNALSSGVWSSAGAPITGNGSAARRFFSKAGKTKEFFRVITP